MIQKLTTWRKRHRIESFGACLMLLLCLIGINVVTIKVYANANDKDYLDGTAIYTTEFTTSLSGVKGYVTELYTNPSHTKVAIMLNFEDPSSLSTQASEYKIYYRNWNISKSRRATQNLNDPKGGFYIYGTTGYAMIWLVNSDGFKNTAAQISVGNETPLKIGEGNEELKSQDAYFAESDGFRFYINPRGKSATYTDVLDAAVDEDDMAMRIYQMSVINESETDQRDKLLKDVEDLNTGMATLMEKKATLETLQVNVPAISEQIYGDNFSIEDGTLIYTPDYIFPDGVNFDWFHNTLSNASFLEAFMNENGQSDRGFLESLQQKSANYQLDTLDDARWTLIDGTQVSEDDAESRMSDVSNIGKAIKEYKAAYNEYLQLKHQYQSEDLVDYLRIEYSVRSSVSMYTSTFGNVIVF